MIQAMEGKVNLKFQNLVSYDLSGLTISKMTV